MNKVIADDEWRQLHVYGEINENKVLFTNVYTPNEDDPTFFDGIFREALEAEVDIKIMGGDFNKVLNTQWDRKSLSKVEKS